MLGGSCIKKLSPGIAGTLFGSGYAGLGLLEKVDFVLAFYMVHEVPDQDRFLNEVWSTLKANGQFLMVEPTFRVSKAEFEKTIAKAVNLGFAPVERPKLFLSKAVVLKKE